MDGDLKNKGFGDNFFGWLLDSGICDVFGHLKRWFVILFQKENEFLWFTCVAISVWINFKDF